MEVSVTLALSCRPEAPRSHRVVALRPEAPAALPRISSITKDSRATHREHSWGESSLCVTFISFGRVLPFTSDELGFISPLSPMSQALRFSMQSGWYQRCGCGNTAVFFSPTLSHNLAVAVSLVGFSNPYTPCSAGRPTLCSVGHPHPPSAECVVSFA